MTEVPQNESSDTAAGCRSHAEQDRARAQAMDTDNGRLRLQRSAKAWDVRAAELDDLAETEQARHAMAIAEWDEGERAEQHAEARGDDDDAS